MNVPEVLPLKGKGRALPYQLNLSDLPPFDPTSPVAEPPSPVPTEIIDIEGEDFTRTAKQYGAKVRDFAYEEPKAGVSTIPELWRNPFMSLLCHDMHIRRPLDSAFECSGKMLYRLLDVGLVTEEEAKRHWTPVDWQRMKVYTERPQGPYPYCVGMKRPNPSRSYRVAARMQFYGDPLPSDVPDSAIFMPEDGPNMWEGDEATEEMGQLAKKRRLESEERKRNAAQAKANANAAATTRAFKTQAGPSSPKVAPPTQSDRSSPSPSQQDEYSQVTNPIYSGEDDLLATPPATPIALPDDRPTLSRTTSRVETAIPAATPSTPSRAESSTAAATSPASTSNNPALRSRKLGRTQTFSLLMVR